MVAVKLLICSLVAFMALSVPPVQPCVPGWIWVSGMVNLAGSEKCYGDKTYGRCLVWHQESLKIMFQAREDLSTITGSAVTYFGEKVRS